MAKLLDGQANAELLADKFGKGAAPGSDLMQQSQVKARRGIAADPHALYTFTQKFISLGYIKLASLCGHGALMVNAALGDLGFDSALAVGILVRSESPNSLNNSIVPPGTSIRWARHSTTPSTSCDCRAATRMRSHPRWRKWRPCSARLAALPPAPSRTRRRQRYRVALLRWMRPPQNSKAKRACAPSSKKGFDT